AIFLRHRHAEEPHLARLPPEVALDAARRAPRGRSRRRRFLLQEPGDGGCEHLQLTLRRALLVRQLWHEVLPATSARRSRRLQCSSYWHISMYDTTIRTSVKLEEMDVPGETLGWH